VFCVATAAPLATGTPYEWPSTDQVADRLRALHQL